MKRNVFYGEYSLSHWVNLIISKNIVLPEYQRLFVWKKEKVQEFLNSLNNNEYVPPVTIGAFKINGKTTNYILDGQQRLTSILLACIGKFPKKVKEFVDIDRGMNENDDVEEEEDHLDISAIQDWTFTKLTDMGDTYAKITDKIEADFKELYENFGEEYSSGFYHNHYLGFSYIVPDTDDEGEQQKFYSSVFRNINIKGERLLEMESRESLYFLNKEKKDFFRADFKEYVVNNNKEQTHLDFVRYMALLSQYDKDPEHIKKVARGYKPKMEEYYEQYIYDMVGARASQLFQPFNTVFPDGNYKTNLDRLRSTLGALDLPKQYSSIIDIDVHFFGLIYSVVFEKKTLDSTRRNELKEELNAQITNFKDDYKHKKSPASLKYLRSRIQKSIGIYHKYEKNE